MAVRDAKPGDDLWYDCPNIEGPRQGQVIEVIHYDAMKFYVLEIFCIVDYTLVLKSQYQVRREK